MGLKLRIHVFGRLICAALIVGCVGMGPEYQRPEPVGTLPDSFEQVSAETAGYLVDDAWWREFNDPDLDRLVQDVLAYNWDLKQAAARILEARARFRETRSDRYPELGFNAGADRRNLSGNQGSAELDITSYELSLGASYEVDLWGRFASLTDAARSDLLAEEETRRTLAQSIVAETVLLYLEIESLERRIQIARQNIDSFRRSLEFVSTRYRRGLISVLDVRQARRVLAQAEAVLPELEQLLGLRQQELAVLLGRYPTTSDPRQQPEDYFQQMPPVPPGLPSELLQRRPDIRAAEARLQAANRRIGAAKAARFPSIFLTGEYGFSSDELNRLVDLDFDFWSATAGLTQPIFNAGRLKANQRGAEARYEQEAAVYARTLLTAFSEVEAALLTRKKQIERRERLYRFREEARATGRVAAQRYIRGLTPYLDVLDAQRTRFEAEDQLVRVELLVLGNRVQLYRALGGNWAAPDMSPDALLSDAQVTGKGEESP